MARPQTFNTDEALHKAMGAFWRKGYEGTSLTDLLAATGLSKSSLYGTFGGKHDLFISAFDAYRAERARDMHLILERGSGRAGVEAFFRVIVEDARLPEFANGCMSINQAVEMAPHDPEVRRRVVGDFQGMETAIATAISRGQADGSVQSKKSPADLAKLLVVAFPGLQVMVRAGYSPEQLEQALSILFSSFD